MMLRLRAYSVFVTALAMLSFVGAALGSTGCARGPREATTAPPPPPVLRALEDWPGPYALRQHVTAEFRGRQHEFDAVLERNEEGLTLVGLGPMGQVGFVVRYDGTEVEVDNRIGERGSFPPEYMLADVQRVYFPWLEGACDAPTRRGERAPMEVIERCEDGHVVERRLIDTRLSSDAETVVRFRGARLDGGIPEVAEIESRAFDYRLVIETDEVVRAPGAG